jgi:hypothetical protein
MPNTGCYLYGFTDRRCAPPPGLRGLAGAPVRLLSFGDLAAVVSDHPVQRLMPQRRHVEPHHAVVRHVCANGALVPAAFGHISETDEDIVHVVRANYDAIRAEIERLGHRCEMTVKLRWSVENIFDWLVRHNADLRELRDRVFRNRQPSMNEKLQVGAQFEATLARERGRLTALLLDALSGVTLDVQQSPPRDERMVCLVALLVDRPRGTEFDAALRVAATRFNGDFTLDYSGPWPPYSFVRLRLEPGTHTSAA